MWRLTITTTEAGSLTGLRQHNGGQRWQGQIDALLLVVARLVPAVGWWIDNATAAVALLVAVKDLLPLTGFWYPDGVIVANVWCHVTDHQN